MQAEDLNIIDRTEPSVLAAWYCTLNDWGWPTGLPELEPDGGKWVSGGRRGLLMRAIKAKIGAAAVHAEWNAKRFSLSLRATDSSGAPTRFEIHSRARSLEDAFADFSRDVAELRRCGFQVDDFTHDDVSASGVGERG